MRKTLDITGQKFNKLTVIEFNKIVGDSKGRRKSYWIVKCDCGTIKSLSITAIRNQQSCGCLLKEYQKNKLPQITKNRNSIGEGLASFNNLYSNYRDRAKKINTQFSLTKEEFRDITSKNCFYCNIEPLQVFHRKTYNGSYVYNGIDRLNNNKGYIKENVVPCCEICNKAKRDMEFEEFIKWIKKLTEYASKISFDYKTGN